jgi:formylglycine-generating enzyme required for sulfatase activity
MVAGALGRTLRGDLDWIVMKALEKDRTRRYSTALELAADLDRHLQHLPVLAGAPTLGHRLRKYVRRHRLQVGTMALLAIATTATSASLLVAKEKSAAFQQIAGLVVHKRTLDAERELYPPWPEQLPAITRWLEQDYRALAGITDRLPQARDQLRARSASPNAKQPVFADSADALLWDALEQLAAALPDLEQRRASVEARSDWAQRIAAASVERTDLWQPAIDAIARSPSYGGLRLAPQMGLVPIGENPVTQLWEFYELRSACEAGVDPARVRLPQHRADGTIDVADATGIVFALLPAAEFTIGAHPDDPDAGPSERHQDRVRLDAFFLARHELTQGQWQRLAFDRARPGPPSYFHPLQAVPGLPAITWAHPVEQVSWHEADELLTHNGLQLPTEAQWEYGCRAGTTTRWSCGDDPRDLPEVAHLFGLHADDPVFSVHVTVGCLRANAFGIHDMHGNVLEWCRDVRSDYRTDAAAPGDGLRHGQHPQGNRIVRGGSWDDDPNRARSSNRYSQPPDTKVKNLGLRAARAIQRGP